MVVGTAPADLRRGFLQHRLRRRPDAAGDSLGLCLAPLCEAARRAVARMNSWLHQGIIWIHIAAGMVALASGTVAVGARKGGAMHASAGTWFAVAMLVLGVTASILEPFRSPPGSPIGGIMVCYFVATAWMTARRRDGTPGRFEKIACAAALGTAA